MLNNRDLNFDHNNPDYDFCHNRAALSYYIRDGLSHKFAVLQYALINMPQSLRQRSIFETQSKTHCCVWCFVVCLNINQNIWTTVL